jgi:alanine dehydrogenase
MTMPLSLINCRENIPLDNFKELFKIFNPHQLLDAENVGRQVRLALQDLSHHHCYGVKAVLQPGEEELQSLLQGRAETAYSENERPNWKLSTLVSVNQHFGAVKIVGSHSYNKQLNMPRSKSLIILYDKLTMVPLAMMDGTMISARRTGSYASISLGLIKPEVKKNKVFIIGAGEIAQAVIDDLVCWSANKIGCVFVLSRTLQSAQAFARRNDKLPFEVVAVNNRTQMPDCDFVITASNSSSPCYELQDLKSDALILHLGGDETPEALIEQALLHGSVVCDDIHCVSSRGSQSVARYFSTKGETLEKYAAQFDVKNLYDQKTQRQTSPDHRTLITCVGLPVLDLYVAQYLFMTFMGDATNDGDFQ